MQPPQNLGIAPKSHEAALFAISQSAMHWSIAQYCVMHLQIAFALMAFNEHLPVHPHGLNLYLSRTAPILQLKTINMHRRVPVLLSLRRHQQHQRAGAMISNSCLRHRSAAVSPCVISLGAL